MIFPNGVHPSADELRAYGSGRLAADHHAEIERHIAECETCCQFVATALEDTLQRKLAPGGRRSGKFSCRQFRPGCGAVGRRM